MSNEQKDLFDDNSINQKNQELIKITEINGSQFVDARELHQFLESKQQFADWIKSRIEKYGFVEGVDYFTLHKNMKRENGGATTRIEYSLSIDMGKEVSMVETNEKGKIARKYFIEVEKRYKLQKPKDLATLLIEAGEELRRKDNIIQEKETKLIEQTPFVEAFQTFLSSKNSFTMSEIAKALSDILEKGRNTLFKILREQKILRFNNEPYQRYIDEGYFVTRFNPIKHSDYVESKPQTLVTPKGAKWIRELVLKYNEQ